VVAAGLSAKRQSQPMHRSKLHLCLIALAGISLGEVAPEQDTKQHKIRHISIIVF
jgi:hypothetical protein